MQVEIDTDEFLIDARLPADLLRLDPTNMDSTLETRDITSICERGIGEREGEYRSSFLYGNSRARLNVDVAEKLNGARGSTLEKPPLPRQLHRASG
jgi:hypothetical protein